MLKTSHVNNKVIKVGGNIAKCIAITIMGTNDPRSSVTGRFYLVPKGLEDSGISIPEKLHKTLEQAVRSARYYLRKVH